MTDPDPATTVDSAADLLRLLLEDVTMAEPAARLQHARITAIEGDSVEFTIGDQEVIRTPLSEWSAEHQAGLLAAGAIFAVYCESLSPGAALVSRRKARQIEAWLRMESTAGEIHKGQLRNRIKPGYIMEIEGAEVFLPRSQIHPNIVQSLQDESAREIPLKIQRVDYATGSIVATHRDVQKIDAAQRAGTFEIGQVLTGRVENIKRYGAFVDLGGINGLLHLTEIDHRRHDKMPEYITIGSVIDVEVIGISGHRISLSTKRFHRDRWQECLERFPVGSKVLGRVTNIVDYGCFIELDDGIEGLLHRSEFSWTRKSLTTRDTFERDQRLDLLILDIDLVKRRISLSLKRLSPSPWPAFLEAFKVGTRITGTVTAKATTLLVAIDGGPEALMTIPLSLDSNVSLAAKEILVGQRVAANVAKLNAGEEDMRLEFAEFLE